MTGDIGTLDHFTRHRGWALVRWDVTGPGMVCPEGLSFVAPTLLACHTPPVTG